MSLMFGFHMPNFTFADARGPALFDRVVEQAKAAEA
ncbi:MAG: LLM class F420-dependent oxidoreductase, partial [Chloroflexi bacterium]